MTPLVMALYWVALFLLALSAMFSWLFVVRFSRVRWYETPEGRHLMRFTTVLGLIFTFTLFGQLVRPLPLTNVVLSCVLFGWTAFELGNRVRLEHNAQREAREQARDASR